MKVKIEVFPHHAKVWILDKNEPTMVEVHSCTIHGESIIYTFYYGVPTRNDSEVFATKKELVESLTKRWSC
jgi:hypothetical protein